MQSVLISPPTSYGVTVSQAKAQSRVLNSAEDDVIEGHLAAALAYAEKYTGRIYQPQTWELTVDAFPTAEIKLTPGPVASITSIQYIDADGATITVADTLYETDLAGDDAWVGPSTPWPATMATFNAVKITYVAGRGQMPADMRQAIIMLAAHYYQDREGTAPFPEGVERILRRHLRYFI
jgi:uncharacterized phiE125 gp8 family phage protein